MALAVWVKFPRAKTFSNITSASRYKTANALRRAALAEARGAKVWARFSPSATASANQTAGDANLEVDVRALIGVPLLHYDGGKLSEA